MLHENLIALRKLKHMTQEDLADALGVSRQAVSKWESGQSAPDLEKGKQLAELFGVTLDDLVHFTPEFEGIAVPPRGKHIFGLVKVGEKGQIVIPAKARQIFAIAPGDSLLVLGDEGEGIALVKEKDFLSLAEQIRKMK